jgi:hypothetical protein
MVHLDPCIVLVALWAEIALKQPRGITNRSVLLPQDHVTIAIQLTSGLLND